ncbi:TROVE domain-containing protein [Amycolatopsis thermoflava]|uniref:TROVE domain-containing protein n=1 Tax=Amycolatopsis thermoflava TaxID=84480 RepID=A0A3N2H0H1_9PSEU|nr:TROVE domain-containing protein [Amycolatopsis thermoflava]ROS42418.1 TROVE domain-containing protein [Amycolatopsis thermoflava]
MSKFNLLRRRPAARSPIVTVAAPGLVNHQGGAGHVRDAKSELFLLAVANMVGEDTFYEAADDRDSRYAELVRRVALKDPQWTSRFLRWLRTEANMRSASLVGAAEFVKARLDNRADDGLSNRAVVASVLQRADEPGELIAYWFARYGRRLPKPVKRGVADAVRALYDERSFLKWDSGNRGVRFADVLRLVHPAPRDAVQDALFEHILRDGPPAPELTVLTRRRALMALPVDQRRAALDPAELRAAGMTWEALAGWLQGPLDAEAWQAVIPGMGYMALLRNVRNFDEAGIPDEVADRVAARLADPGQVARSRQFPFRFLSAYRSARSSRWDAALERALDASLANVPSLPGRTLILIDRSASMWMCDRRSAVTFADQAAVFGCALAVRAEKPTVVVFGWDSREVEVPRDGALLPFVESLDMFSATNTAAAVRRHYRRHDRVVLLTDEQSATADASAGLPRRVPLYVWNVAGYRYGGTPSGLGNRHTFGGLTDAAFRMIPLLEAGRVARWPF